MKQQDIVKQLKKHFDSKASQKVSATSPDSNLREVEIAHISKYLKNNQNVLDLGCGNGYSTLIYASKFKSNFLGLDYSKPMIEAAKKLNKKIKIKGNVTFETSDVLNAKLLKNHYDVVITQRLMINLQSKKTQKKMLKKIHDALKPGGFYLMCEGTLQGNDRLNKIRKKVNLNDIPNTSSANFWSLKFNEKQIEQFLGSYFSIEKIQPFGIYFLISRILYPMMIKPKKPRFTAKINQFAKELETKMEHGFDIGHQRLFILKKNR
jgi:ubiquinone/menaquinone biosynthesis C-methylase UbiE